LESWVRSRSKPYGLVRRAQIILLLDQGVTITKVARNVNVTRVVVRNWAKRFIQYGINGLYDEPGRGRKPVFSPDVAMHIIKIACERPDLRERSLSQWDCTEIARELVRSGVVDDISTETVRRILKSQKLKPWRHHIYQTVNLAVSKGAKLKLLFWLHITCLYIVVVFSRQKPPGLQSGLPCHAVFPTKDIHRPYPA